MSLRVYFETVTSRARIQNKMKLNKRKKKKIPYFHFAVLRETPIIPVERDSSILQGWIKRRNIILKRNIFDVTNEKHLGIFHIVTKLDRKETLPCSFGPVKRNTCNISLYVEIRASMSWLLDKKGEPKPGFCPAFSSRNYFAIVNFGPEIWWKFSGRPLIRNTARGAVKFILRYWK